jgi:non-specific serine/threonine protein kinase
LAATFSDGVVFVPLAPVADPDLVLPTIARGLGGHELGTRFPADLITDYLRRRRLLLVLDNFEQVRGAAPQVAALLAACPELVILVTSRALLRVAGEQRFPVSPLALPEALATDVERTNDRPLETITDAAAVQLFVARAQAVEPEFALDADNAATIAAICNRLDGLPLAIELAAARIRLLSLTDLLARLDRTLTLLTEGPDDAPHRLRTMRDAIAWSYDLLGDEEQMLFRRLAIFVGGFTVEAAEEVTEAGRRGSEAPMAVDPPHSPSLLDLIASLLDKSLVHRTAPGGDTRFSMLETVREFGLERLAASGETEVIAARHAMWCTRLAEGVRRSGQLSHARGLISLDLEHPNLRAALGWLLAHGEPTAALHLAGLLAEFWMRHGHLAEGEVWLERALTADNGEPTAARAEALVGLNMLLWPRDDFVRAERLLAEAETVARAAGDAGALAHTRLHQGYVAAWRGDVELAMERAEEALATCEAIPQGFSPNAPLWLMAWVELARGEDERASVLHERLLASARAGGDEISLANGLYGLAILAERRGEASRALAGFAEAAAVCRGFGDRLQAARCLDGAAAASVALGRMEPAVRLYAAADAQRKTVVVPVLAFMDDRPRHERAIAMARAALSAERFAGAWDAGAALSLDEAIAEAGGVRQPPTCQESARSGAGAAALTPREAEVLRLLVAGWSDKEMAAELGIGRRTASNYVAAIRSKLDAPSRTAAVAIAVRDHLV